MEKVNFMWKRLILYVKIIYNIWNNNFLAPVLPCHSSRSVSFIKSQTAPSLLQPSTQTELCLSNLAMNEDTEKSGDYEEILQKVGEFGKFQKMILVLLSCVSAAGGLVVVVFPFTAYQPNYRCADLLQNMLSGSNKIFLSEICNISDLRK